MPRSWISRRALLVSASAAMGCARRKARAFHGYCFVANQESRSVAVVDLMRFRVRKQIALDAAPAGIVAAGRRAKVFVLAPATGTVYEIDSGSLAIARRAKVGNQAIAIQGSPTRENEALWVLATDPPALVELPLDSFRPRRRIPLPAAPDAFDLSIQKQAAIAIPQDNRIVLASLDTGQVERVIAAGSEPSLVRFQRDGKRVLAGSGPEHQLMIFDVPTGKTIVRLPLPLAPRHFCFNSDGGQLFVTGDGMDAVVIVYPYRAEIAETMLAGRAPAGMAVAPASRAGAEFLLVANPQTDSVTVLDFDSPGKKLVAVVQVGQSPHEIVVTPDHEYALVLNEKSGDLAVIRTLALAFAPNGSPRRYQTAPLFTLVPTGAKPVGAAVVELT